MTTSYERKESLDKISGTLRNVALIIFELAGIFAISRYNNDAWIRSHQTSKKEQEQHQQEQQQEQEQEQEQQQQQQQQLFEQNEATFIYVLAVDAS